MYSILRARSALAAATAATAASFAACTAAPSSGRKQSCAVAILGPSPADKSDSGVRGTVVITQPRGGLGESPPVKLRVRVTGLKPGPHGFHVHALGDLTKGCMSAGGHYNPAGAPHGGPGDSFDRRHAGDLGNVVADASGVVDTEIEDTLLTLRGELSILGRSIILHADADDLGKGDFPDSKTTGHAGARLACGVIGVAEDVDA